MKQAEEYVFCPVCAKHNWMIDRNKDSTFGELTVHRCGSCAKFKYIELSVSEKRESGIIIYYKVLYQEEVRIDKYEINIYHKNNQTTVYDNEKGSMLLNLNHAVKFDWYREKNIIDKIKKMLVFS